MLLLGLTLGGCASTVADLPVVGLPEGTPARPATQADYLAVHDLPAPRAEKVLTPDEVAKAEKDLMIARNRQAFGAKPAAARRPKAAKTADPAPTASTSGARTDPRNNCAADGGLC